ncbi:type II toxin-antitoxin system HipA family toxin [Arenibaculum sp.]|uniref:type II toxin-antitoxin system HipA family toxin n=1 Tax=Arenibaculum sp. TaxID=2865862 RepID=UPI002E113C74|nr:type II toxin-antitoxin system HipA family toxin [Arenibaculum sp.]
MPTLQTGIDDVLSKPPVLNVFLGTRPVGQIIGLPGDKNTFAFFESYLEDRNRPIVSLGFKGPGGIIAYKQRVRQTKVDPFFSNLLPEGPLRAYAAGRNGIHPDREFHLLRILGEDLPGAVVVRPAEDAPPTDEGLAAPPAGQSASDTNAPVKFSLAGVQMKLSALRKVAGGLTIPASGKGGRWIVKFPSERFQAVPENEFWMMTMARRIGLDVPDIDLVPIDSIVGLPPGIRTDLGRALAIRRFDRTEAGGRIHMEDFAQIFRIYPHDKYDKANFDRIGEVIFSELGEEGLQDYVARLVFTAAIGNGDMHVKNWSILYTGIGPRLAPVYDYLSTLTYVSGIEDLGMNLGGSKRFSDIDDDLFARFADNARLPGTLVHKVVGETVKRVTDAWAEIRKEAELPRILIKAIDTHMATLPIMKRDTLITTKFLQAGRPSDRKDVSTLKQPQKRPGN